MQAVQLVLADPVYAAGLREALTRTGPWTITSGGVPDLSQRCVIVMDEEALARTPLPLIDPERVVLIGKGSRRLSQAWDAGIVSVVSDQDPPNTVLLAIMAASLRIPRCKETPPSSGFSPGSAGSGASTTPGISSSGPKRPKPH
jgi:hypothetical protein